MSDTFLLLGGVELFLDTLDLGSGVPMLGRGRPSTQANIQF